MINMLFLCSMKKREIELTEPIVKMLAHAYRQRNDIWHNFMEDHAEEVYEEGSESWYDDEYNNFFSIICDLDEELKKKKSLVD